MITEKISTMLSRRALRRLFSRLRALCALPSGSGRRLVGRRLIGLPTAVVMAVVTVFLGLVALVGMFSLAVLLGLLAWLALVCFASLLLLTSVGAAVGRIGRMGIVAMVALFRMVRSQMVA